MVEHYEIISSPHFEMILLETINSKRRSRKGDKDIWQFVKQTKRKPYSMHPYEKVHVDSLGKHRRIPTKHE